MPQIPVGVLGATGAVGQRFCQLLEGHPWFKVAALAASKRSAGKPYQDAVDWRLSTPIPEELRELQVIPTRADDMPEDVKIVFSSLPADIARQVEAEYARAGFVVSSNAASYRMFDDVPLLIPEVNKEHAKLIHFQKDERGWDGCIVTNPNCSTIMLTMTLKPLMGLGLTDVKVATLQAVSGAGYTGVSSMAILDNVVPYIGGEEEKMQDEPLKLLGTFNGEKVINADITVSAICNRVPVIDGHTESVWVDVDAPPEQVKEAMASLQPLAGLPFSPKQPIVVREEDDRPQPRLDRDINQGMTVSVGRVRRDVVKGIKYTLLGHNTVRGAAGASILNAEMLADAGYLT
ncbi:MAG: aspartate-semialdehyde dehydrogenase [Halobacteriota archaeon]